MQVTHETDQGNDRTHAVAWSVSICASMNLNLNNKSCLGNGVCLTSTLSCLVAMRRPGRQTRAMCGRQVQVGSH